MSKKSWAVKPRKPTILQVQDTWQREEKYISIEELEAFDPGAESEADRSTMPSRLKFRQPRTLLLCVLVLAAWIFYTKYYQPHMENLALTQSVTEGPFGTYAAHSQTKLTDMVLIHELDQALVPTPGRRKDRNGRLVIVGDVHGMKVELEKLLDKVDFDTDTDHLILAGDMISKGPDSIGVLDLIMELGASAVRGNHEDRILLAYERLHSGEVQVNLDPPMDGSASQDDGTTGVEMVSKKGEYKDHLLAKQLSHKHIQWLKKCPVILKIGDIEGMGQVLVVHAGLVPGINLKAQDPYFVMNMRTIDLKTHVPSDSSEGTEWTKLWNHYQARLEPRQRSTAIYGHDSKRGLSINTYSKGLDTGCLKGGQLTAFVIEGGSLGMKQSVIQVECADGRV